MGVPAGPKWRPASGSALLGSLPGEAIHDGAMFRKKIATSRVDAPDVRCIEHADQASVAHQAFAE